MNEGLFALLGAIFGGVGLKILERIFVVKDRQLDDAAAIRQELREEIRTLRKEINEARGEIDKWRNDYYTILQKYNGLVTENEDLKRDMEYLKKTLNLKD